MFVFFFILWPSLLTQLNQSLPQLHYPSNPWQPGPIYFMTPRKAALVGLCCEAIPRQVNFIIDEASDTGKGANAVVSIFARISMTAWAGDFKFFSSSPEPVHGNGRLN